MVRRNGCRRHDECDSKKPLTAGRAGHSGRDGAIPIKLSIPNGFIQVRRFDVLCA